MGNCQKCGADKPDNQKKWCDQCLYARRLQRAISSREAKVCWNCEKYYIPPEWNGDDDITNRWFKVDFCSTCLKDKYEECKKAQIGIDFKNGLYDPTPGSIKVKLRAKGITDEFIVRNPEILSVEQRMSAFKYIFSFSKKP